MNVIKYQWISILLPQEWSWISLITIKIQFWIVMTRELQISRRVCAVWGKCVCVLSEESVYVLGGVCVYAVWGEWEWGEWVLLNTCFNDPVVSGPDNWYLTDDPGVPCLPSRSKVSSWSLVDALINPVWARLVHYQLLINLCLKQSHVAHETNS